MDFDFDEDIDESDNDEEDDEDIQGLPAYARKGGRFNIVEENGDEDENNGEEEGED
jgi:hypothetical protein